MCFPTVAFTSCCCDEHCHLWTALAQLKPVNLASAMLWARHTTSSISCDVLTDYGHDISNSEHGSTHHVGLTILPHPTDRSALYVYTGVPNLYYVFASIDMLYAFSCPSFCSSLECVWPSTSIIDVFLCCSHGATVRNIASAVIYHLSSITYLPAWEKCQPRRWTSKCTYKSGFSFDGFGLIHAIQYVSWHTDSRGYNHDT